MPPIEPDLWSTLAFLALSIGSGAVTAGLVMLIGGVGGQLALSRRLSLAEDRQEDLDAKIDREIKRRSGQAGVAARKDAKSIEEEAGAIVAAHDRAAPVTRPSVARRR